MKIVKKILKGLFYFLLIPVSFLVVSLILSSITIDREEDITFAEKSIYLSTNGVHLNIVMPMKNIENRVLLGLKYEETDDYLSFGWGDENFYINTPTWGDLTFKNAFTALFLNSSTLMHVNRHEQKQSDWIEIKISESELKKINTYLLNSFKTDTNGMKIRLRNKGYTPMDDFYKSEGNYSIFKTCNSWVNTGFKKSGLKACLWTPFDFGLMNKYK